MLIRNEIMTDEATESWEVVKQVFHITFHEITNIKKLNFKEREKIKLLTMIFSNHTKKRISVDFLFQAHNLWPHNFTSVFTSENKLREKCEEAAAQRK